MHKPKLLKSEQGLTMIEVLFAILITTIFLTVAMQMMAVAAIFKARAQQNAEATTWIQKDLESLRFEASQIGLKNVDSMKSSADATNSSQILISNHGLSDGDKVMFMGSGIAEGLSTNKVYYVVSANTNTFKVSESSGGSAITLTSNSTGDLISVATTKCTSSATTGYADGLRDLINDSTNASLNIYSTAFNASDNTTTTTFRKESSLTKQQFDLVRTNEPDSNDSKVLKVTYKVTPISGGKSVADFYTEVIPNAALYCPN
ncbi:type IV pilus modification PilV family protein [Chroococcidiopsis sp.]|uniref:type IV pilus modification PilV family protein n=1 Tax=Chroococcidiopsis sp. TaxID=3088168 RepID=UPI003F343F26